MGPVLLPANTEDINISLNLINKPPEQGQAESITPLDINSEDIPETQVESRKWWHQYIGLILALIASFSFALNSIISKVLVDNYNVFVVSFVRFQGVFFPSLVFMLHARFIKNEPIFEHLRPFSENRLLLAVLIIRGILGSIVGIVLTSAIKFISVADTIVIKSCSPLLVVFFAGCFLKEPIGVIPILCGIQIILGVFCIAKPPFITRKQDYNMDTLYGTMLALALAMAASLGIICMRYSRRLHFSLPALSFGIIGSLLTGIVCGILGVFKWPENLQDTLCFLAVAILTAVTQILTVVALKYDNAGITSLVRASEIFFAFLLEILILHIIPDPLSAIGSIIVILSVIITVANKNNEVTNK